MKVIGRRRETRVKKIFEDNCFADLTSRHSTVIVGD
jgi:hypothetical protein